jgi:glucosamine 6-phosphate synthetase-like amidotransferase/phosphosugar isomerase protein
VKSKICVTKIWFDDDMIELSIEVTDGESSFTTTAYVGHQRLREIISELDRFKDHVHGGIYDLRFGEFGPEYAAGAFHARMHFQNLGRIYITVSAQSEFKDFGKKNVASEMTLYLVSQPAQLDNFVLALTALSDGQRDDAVIEAV